MDDLKFFHKSEVLDRDCKYCGFDWFYKETTGKSMSFKCQGCSKFHSWVPGSIDDFEMPFGKHKGEYITKVPKDYLIWLSKQSGIKGTLKRRIGEVVND